MCCGKNTLPKSFTRNQVAPSKVIPIRPPAKPSTNSPTPARVHMSMPLPTFVYIGDTGLTVVSPITGKRYRFGHAGARLEVDARDTSWMKFVPNLKTV